MTTVRLPKGSWEIDFQQQLGSKGGFGTVYAGTREGFPPLAIKRLDITSRDSANRELRIAEQLSGRGFKHIIPIFDSGQDADTDFYYIVMARAERSLGDELRRRGHFEEVEAVKVLLEIVSGIQEVSDLIHRDLKPGNVLLHDGLWKIADFGIAKFVEESTSLQTLKGSLTRAYAAPEQWELKKVASSTDLYALGCIAYELISGHTPFQAETDEEYRQKHLFSEPPALQTHSPQLRSLVSMLLRKSPESRPSIDRVRTILEKVISDTSSHTSSSGLSELAQVGAVEAERAAAIEVKASLEIAENRRRLQLARDASSILQEVLDEFFRQINDASPSAIVGDRSISLGNATIMINSMNLLGDVIPPNAFPNSKWDVISGAIIALRQEKPRYDWCGNLWYTNLGKENHYRWYETSYWCINNRLVHPFAPIALVILSDADLAHSNIAHIYSVATTPKPIDGENIIDFVDRWSKLFAQAVKGKISYPSYLPID